MTTTTDRSTLPARAGAVAAAVLAALAVWVLAVPVLGVALAAVPIGGPVQDIGPVAVAAGPLCAGLSGWALLAVLERRAARPRRTWTAVAIVVLVLSLVTPLLGGVGSAATVTLVAMHVVAGGVLIALLPRR
jgi:hypothetical protein